MDTLGIVEARSIAAGVELADAMMKAADVELIRATTICSGRYMVYVAGERDAVATSVKLAEASGRSLAGSFILSNVSPEVVAVLKRGSAAEAGQAIAVIESRNVSSGVAAADQAVKRSAIHLLRLVTGQGINGKSYFVISGDVASVEEATETANSALGKNLVEAVVIPNPDASVVRALTSAMR